MQVLLDTNVAIKGLREGPDLSDAARRIMIDPDNRVVVSIASVWEVAIKASLKRNRAGAFDTNSRRFAADLDAADLEVIPIELNHAFTVEELPPIHGDPFDRLIVAQALSGPYRLLTTDRLLGRYSDTVIVV